MNQSRSGAGGGWSGPNGAVLAFLYLAVVLLPLLLAHLTGQPQANRWRELASAAGLVAGAALMLQFVTSGRFETLSGRIGIDVTMTFHKWAARTLLLVVLLHPLLFVGGDFLDYPPRAVNRIAHMLVSPRYFIGVLALLLILAMVLVGLKHDRLRLPYEAWRATHLIGALAAAILLVLHAARAGNYSRASTLTAVWLVLGLVVLVSVVAIYGLRLWRTYARPWEVTGNRLVARGLHEITLAPVGHSGFDFRAGQFAWVSFAPWRFPIADHPFSIASAPGEPLKLLIKEAGDFTSRAGEIAPGVRAGLDAPHGSFVAEAGDDPLLLVAGGVGIAPIVAILRGLKASGDRRPVRVIYAGVSPATMIAREEIADAAAGLDVKIDLVAEEAAATEAYRRGRVDELVLRDVLAGLSIATVRVMICGPAPMMCHVCDLLHAMGVPLASIRYERFDYADGARSTKERSTLVAFAAMALAVAAAMAAFVLRA